MHAPVPGPAPGRYRNSNILRHASRGDSLRGHVKSGCRARQETIGETGADPTTEHAKPGSGGGPRFGYAQVPSNGRLAASQSLNPPEYRLTLVNPASIKAMYNAMLEWHSGLVQ